MFYPIEKTFSSARDINAPVFLFNKKEITYGEFYFNIQKLSEKLATSSQKDFLLYCEDTFLFSIGFFALLKANKNIIMPQNIQPDSIKEIGENKPILTDIELSYNSGNVIDIKYEEKTISKIDNIDFSSSQIIFYTSGSTGKPKRICKTIANLAQEITELENMWGSNIEYNSLFVSTVSHQHIYGLLFRFLWPLCRGNIIESSLIFSPEALIGLSKISQSFVIISSPAFLKRFGENDTGYSLPQNIEIIFSSGGLLENEVSTKVRKLLGYYPMEILGSTETGGIAYRSQENSEVWKTFSKVKINIDSNNQLLVQSPYFEGEEYVETGDTIDLINENTFKLKERIGRIVKIEEKRISLTEIENKLKSSPLVSDCHTLILSGRRQTIGAAVILNETGNKLLHENGKLSINKSIREYLSQYFDAVVIPRKWRYVEELKKNPQGKISHLDMIKLFDEN